MQDISMCGQKERVQDTAGSYSRQQDPIVPDGHSRDPRQASSRPRPGGAGRDPHPLGHQPGHQGERASVKETSPHTKVTTSSLRMQGDRKEQHSSHSLNQWKERFNLWHRHAGTLTGSEPYKLRGILSKEPRSWMTRLGPSHERGPGTQPHIGPMLASEFSVRICYIQWYKVFNREEDITTFYQCYNNVFNRVFLFIHVTSNVQSVSFVRAVAQCYQYNVFCQGECSYWQGSGPMLFCVHNVTTLKGDNLPLLWYLGKLKFMEEIKCFVKFFVPIPIPWD